MASTSSETIAPIDWEPAALRTFPSTSLTDRRRSWHPKLTPYRFISLVLPVSLGTVKAIAIQQGQQNEPITLEWVCGVVVFILLFSTGNYEGRPVEDVPTCLVWLFKYDCMDALWSLRFKASRGSLTRPGYISAEDVNEEGTIYIVTPYRLLVCSMTVMFGMAKAGLAYRGVATGTTWVEWVLGVIVSSALYVLGLYERNTIGLWSSFFGTNCAHVVHNGLKACVFLGVIVPANSVWLQEPSFIWKITDNLSDSGLVVGIVTGIVLSFFPPLVVYLHIAALQNMLEEMGVQSSALFHLRELVDSTFPVPLPISFIISRILLTTPATFRSVIFGIRHLLFFILSALFLATLSRSLVLSARSTSMKDPLEMVGYYGPLLGVIVTIAPTVAILALSAWQMWSVVRFMWLPTLFIWRDLRRWGWTAYMSQFCDLYGYFASGVVPRHSQQQVSVQDAGLQ